MLLSTDNVVESRWVTYLGSKEESQVAASIQGILDQKGNLLREAETDVAGQGLGLAEVDEVLDGEGKSNRLREGDRHVVLWLVDIGALADGDGAVSDLTLAREFDSVLAGLDVNYYQSVRKICLQEDWEQDIGTY